MARKPKAVTTAKSSEPWTTYDVATSSASAKTGGASTSNERPPTDYIPHAPIAQADKLLAVYRQSEESEQTDDMLGLILGNLKRAMQSKMQL